MEILINNITFSSVFFTLLLLISVYFYFSYNKQKNIYIPLLLRLASISILITLLFEPVIKIFFSEYNKNKMNVILDTSTSMLKNNEDLISELDNFNRYLNDWSYRNKFDISYYSLDAENLNFKEQNTLFKSQSTNYRNINKIIDKESGSFNVLITDGVNTDGTNIDDIKVNEKIYVFGVGENEYIEDISIDEVLLDKTSQAGINEEKLLIKFSSLLSKDNHAILTIKKNNELIITDSLFLSKGNLNYSKTYSLSNDYGTYDIKINSKGLKESNSYNNYYLLTNDKEKNKKNIYVITSSPSFNTPIILDIFSSNSKFNLNHCIINNINKENYIDLEHINKADIIIFDDFPKSINDLNILNDMKNYLEKTPLVYFEGPSASFDISKSFMNIFGPLDIEIIKSNDAVKIRNNTDFPIKRNLVWSSNVKEFKKILVYDDESMCISVSDNLMLVNIPSLSELVLNNQRYETIDIKKHIKNFINNFSKNEKNYNIRLQKNNLIHGESLKFSINEYENYISDDITLNIIDTSNLNKLSIELSKLKMQGNMYVYESTLSHGEYSLFLSSSSFNKENLQVSNNSNFFIADASIEDLSIYLNLKSLITFAERNKGNYYDFKDFKLLFDNLSFSLVKVLNKFEISVLTYYKLWFIVIFLLITEWIIRKRKGLL